MVCDEKIAATGNSNGRLMLFIMELSDDDYVVKRALDLGEAGKCAVHSMICKDGSVYLADSFNNKIYGYNSLNGEFMETTAGRDPRHMCILGESMYVANFESDNISVIDLSCFMLTESIPAGIKTHDVIADEEKKILYTSCYEENMVIEYSLENEKTRRFETDGKPMHLSLQGDSLIVMTYFVNGNVHTKINFIDTAASKLSHVAEIDGLASDMALDENKNTLYVLNIVDKSMYVIDMNSKKIINKIFLGGYPESLDLGEKYIYVTNSKKRQIAAVSKDNLTVENIVDLNFVPSCIKVI
ncbi:MAG: hypothetical protein AAGU76_02465 [Sedimentibacter sp.]|uniref:YncE family protein n=1 Tax=Sedimentibacter sp. TaxID=1960295 RepID=UPI003158571D